MKLRILFTVVCVLVLSLTLANAQGKSDCTAKSTSEKSACCMKGAKMTSASDTKSAACDHAAMAKASYTGDEVKAANCPPSHSKECIAKKCTPAEIAKCDMMKSSMTKSGTKACCKDKGAEAKADLKKGTREKSSDSKGTN